MAIAENGENRRLTPGDIVTGVRRGVGWVRQHPRESLIWGGFYAIIVTIPVASTIYNNWEAPIRKAEAEQRASAQATATSIALDAITQDYRETGGIDLLRQQASYLVTQRGSARLAASDGVLIDNAWARIRKDGCEPLETLKVPEVPGEHPWDRPKVQGAYLVRVNPNC